MLPRARDCCPRAVGCFSSACPMPLTHPRSHPSGRGRGRRSLPRSPRGLDLVGWGFPVVDEPRHGQTSGFQAESIHKMIRALQNSVQVCRRIRDANPMGGEMWGIVNSTASRYAALARSRGHCREAVSQYGGRAMRGRGQLEHSARHPRSGSGRDDTSRPVGPRTAMAARHTQLELTSTRSM